MAFSVWLIQKLAHFREEARKDKDAESFINQLRQKAMHHE